MGLIGHPRPLRLSDPFAKGASGAPEANGRPLTAFDRRMRRLRLPVRTHSAIPTSK
jgi:hypothetical protein